MGEHSDKVEVIEKHYHGNGNQDNKSNGRGLDIAALVTSIATAAGVAVPAFLKGWSGNGSGNNVNPGAAFAAAAMPLFSMPAPSCRRHDCDDEVGVMRAKIAKLEAEKYSDNAAKEESNRLLQNYLKPFGDEIAANQVKMATMQAEIECGKKTADLREQNLMLQIQLAKQEAECCCKANATAIQTVATLVGNVTKTVVPSTVVCTQTTTETAAG